jgi:hypothetical protein
MGQDTGSIQEKIQAADNPLLAAIQKVHAETMPAAALQEIMNHVKGLPGFHCPLVTAAGGLFWCNFGCEAEDGHGGKYQWNHALWGIGSLGGGAGGGTLYTNYTMAAIAAKTVRCAANVTPVTAIATFWADDSTLLASLTAGGYFAPLYGFTGGGAGTWAKTG